ncbi:type II toxin-antitoxin system RelE/ParE family toxin [Steroidobacter sp.]|uniref:type II toxin-antitoxin system RelE/ParE family toxin n=1 Tax=Steroidobacter sp. TaxID=1978227 RepID=UPI0039C9E56E
MLQPVQQDEQYVCAASQLDRLKTVRPESDSSPKQAHRRIDRSVVSEAWRPVGALVRRSGGSAAFEYPGRGRGAVRSRERYEARAPGLGEDFILEVERVTAVLTELPPLGEKLDGVHRRIPLRRFPYGLIFRFDADIIRVVAVAHRRRRPRYWAPRVHDRQQAPAYEV